jgi:glycosyltransferase involved in cell wall biosynthesis
MVYAAGRERPLHASKTRMNPPLVSIVIPVLNEAANLPALMERLSRVIANTDVRWEVVFVDDGSADETLDILKRLNQQDSRIKAISLSRNFGKEIALAAGLRYVTGDAAILMDADLQHPPELVAKFIEKWRAGYQIVYGVRAGRETDSFLRRILSHLFYKIFNAVAKTDIPEGAGDFRLLDRRAIDAMNALDESSRFNKGLFAWIGFKSTGVPFTTEERAHGASRWNFRSLLRFALDGLTSFSTLPLRVWSLVGLTISFIAFVYALIVLVRTLVLGTDVPGFPSLIISVMFFAGVQLITLGVIGEYLGRVYEEVKARPLFIVAEEVGLDGRSGGPRHARRERAVAGPRPESADDST